MPGARPRPSVSVRQVVGTVHREQRPALDAHIARVLEHLHQPLDVGQIVRLVELLLHQQLVVRTLPPPVPALVGPAESEREVGLPGLEDLLERALEHAPPAEPVVVVEEPGDAVFPRQARLTVAGLGHPQVVEPKLSRQIGLAVPRVERTALRHEGPLSEAAAVPGVVLGQHVELGQVEREHVGTLTGGLGTDGSGFGHQRARGPGAGRATERRKRPYSRRRREEPVLAPGAPYRATPSASARLRTSMSCWRPDM